MTFTRTSILSVRARCAGRLTVLSLVGMAFAMWTHQPAAQVAGQSTQGVATLTVLATGSARQTNAPSTNDSGYASGQSLQWVATYKQMELSSIATQSHVLSLGSNPGSPVAQPYVAGSTQAPPRFSKEWNVGKGNAPQWSA